MTGVLYHFPGQPVPRTCFVCPHQQDHSGSPGTTSWCGLFEQPIDSEVVEAASCDAFEVDPDRVRP